MAVLVLAEHDNKVLRKATLNTVAAARKAGGDPHALIPSNAGMILATIVTGILIAVGLVVEGLVAS